MLKHPVGATQAEAFFMLSEERYDKDQGYRLLVVYELMNKACSTKYYLGHDREAAQAYIDQLNLSLGLSPADVHAIYSYITGLDQIGFFEV